MTHATHQAAAIDAAAVAVQIEEIFQRRIGIARLEDVDGPVRLLEHFDTPLRGPGGARMKIEPDKVTVYRGYNEPPLLALTSDQARQRVLAFRAEDPQAAHQRDIATAKQRIHAAWSSYDNDCRRLADPTHPAYRDPAKATDAQRYSEFSEVGGAVHGRDRSSAQIARGLTALARLIAAGPHTPDQGRLF